MDVFITIANIMDAITVDFGIYRRLRELKASNNHLNSLNHCHSILVLFGLSHEHPTTLLYSDRFRVFSCIWKIFKGFILNPRTRIYNENQCQTRIFLEKRRTGARKPDSKSSRPVCLTRLT